MGLTLYNTLTRTKEPFVPIDPANVRMYVCGPTVYDLAHIGNARPVIVFDVLFRLLRHLYGPDHVTYVRNITDVDDKINARAVETWPDLAPEAAIRRLTEETNAGFQADVRALGTLDPTAQPRATLHIAGMVEIIARLIARGFAYAADGHVLFHVPAMPSYGRLSRRSLDDMIAGARVDVAPYKRDPMDFVLWKPSPPELPGWDSPWGRGRPGWHIECSAMAFAELIRPFGGGFDCDDPTRNVFDIHGGGIDLVFPHHENEIAQTCCAFGIERMANVWMHNGFLQVEGEKMSKSLGNFLTIRELLADWPGEVLRFNMLRTHYRQPIDFTLKGLEESEKILRRMYSRLSDRNIDASNPDKLLLNALFSDLNTPDALAHLARIFRYGNWIGSHDDEVTKKGDLSPIDGASFGPDDTFFGAGIEDDAQAAVGLASLNLLGFSGELSKLDMPTARISGGVDAAAVDRLVAERLAARKARDFATSDRIRDQLAAMGVTVKDGKDPVTGEPVTTWEVAR